MSKPMLPAKSRLPPTMRGEVVEGLAAATDTDAALKTALATLASHVNGLRVGPSMTTIPPPPP